MLMKILLPSDYASVALPVHGDVVTYILNRSKQTPWGGDHEHSYTLLIRHRRFYYPSTALVVSVTVRVFLTQISNCSGIAVQWNGGFRWRSWRFRYATTTTHALLRRQRRFYYPSTALLLFLLRYVFFLPKFRIVAELPSSGMGGGGYSHSHRQYHWNLKILFWGCLSGAFGSVDVCCNARQSCSIIEQCRP